MSAERYLVVGLRRSGLAACEALRRVWPAAEVVGVDADRAVDAGRLSGLGVELVVGGELVPLDGVAAVVKSPGVPGDAPQVAAARAAGVPVWAEVELAARMMPQNPIAGVTGTNGKTTTTELLGAMLREGRVPCEVAGNVGRPLTALAGRVDRATWLVTELSSFQLEDIDTLRCRVAVVLNLAPDHLDRHGTFENYTRAKLRILENQRPEDTAILNGDDPFVRGADLTGRGRRVWTGRADASSIDWAHARLRGEHNLENALAAAAAAAAVGVERAAADRALRAFAPLPHRLEVVGRAGGVEWVNDSKATNTASVVMALTAFAGGVHLILGGSVKDPDFRGLAKLVSEGPVVSAYLIGAAAEPIAAALADAGVAHERAGTLEAAVRAAAAAARPGETVLLSPGCASFDQFRDFEHRGDTFRRLARELAGAAA